MHGDTHDEQVLEHLPAPCQVGYPLVEYYPGITRLRPTEGIFIPLCLQVSGNRLWTANMEVD